MLYLNHRFVITMLIITGTITTAKAQSPQYAITDLGSFDGIRSGASSINDSGQIVGYYEIRQSSAHIPYGFLWDNGTVQMLGSDIIPTAVNADQKVVGINGYWENGVLTPLPGFTGYPCVANDINDADCFVGSCPRQIDNDYLYEATLWLPDGTVETLPKIVGDIGRCYAQAINNNNQIVGYAWNTVTWCEAVLWENGTIHPLGENFSSAFDINDNSQIIGLLTASSENPLQHHSFLWQNNQYTDIGPWIASAINNNTQIVGHMEKFSEQRGYYTTSVLYDQGTLYELNELIPKNSGWDLTYVSDINNHGWIVGEGTIDGQTHAFLLTPVPEPGMMAMLLLGGFSLARRRAIKKTMSKSAKGGHLTAKQIFQGH